MNTDNFGIGHRDTEDTEIAEVQQADTLLGVRRLYSVLRGRMSFMSKRGTDSDSVIHEGRFGFNCLRGDNSLSLPHRITRSISSTDMPRSTIDCLRALSALTFHIL